VVCRIPLGLPVEPLLMDYRAYRGPKVDRVISVGMFEHVGSKNFRTYFECARRLLKADGIFLCIRSGRMNALR